MNKCRIERSQYIEVFTTFNLRDGDILKGNTEEDNRYIQTSIVFSSVDLFQTDPGQFCFKFSKMLFAITRQDLNIEKKTHYQ